LQIQNSHNQSQSHWDMDRTELLPVSNS